MFSYSDHDVALSWKLTRATALQDLIHKEHKDTSALWSMCWMNFWCSLYNCIYLFLVTGAGWDLLTFCMAFPEVLLWHVSM